MENDLLKLVIDNDTCPKEDHIIMRGQCGSCKYYLGYLLYHETLCIKCNYRPNNESHTPENT